MSDSLMRTGAASEPNDEWQQFCRQYAKLSPEAQHAELAKLTPEQRTHFQAVWSSGTWRQPSQPKAAPSTAEVFKVAESCQAADGTVVEILECTSLKGSADVRTARSLFFAEHSGMRMKLVRIRLNNSHARVEPGALYYMRGRLEMKASTGGGVLKGLSRKLLSGETFFVNEIHGSGDIYLEPTLGHFIVHSLQAGDDALIVDKELFYAGTSGLDISAVRQKNVSSALFGGEGLFQTKIEGQGIAVLYSPVPASEVDKVSLHGEKLWVDGNFALARTAGVTFRAEKSSKGLVSTAVSGEGLLQTFEGTGTVWVAPTQGMYEMLARPGGLETLAKSPGSMGTKTQSSG